MIYAVAVLAVLLVAQYLAYARERRRLVDLIVARHAGDFAMLQRAGRTPKPRPEKAARPAPKLSEQID